MGEWISDIPSRLCLYICFLFLQGNAEKEQQPQGSLAISRGTKMCMRAPSGRTDVEALPLDGSWEFKLHITLSSQSDSDFRISFSPFLLPCVSLTTLKLLQARLSTLIMRTDVFMGLHFCDGSSRLRPVFPFEVWRI